MKRLVQIFMGALLLVGIPFHIPGLFGLTLAAGLWMVDKSTDRLSQQALCGCTPSHAFDVLTVGAQELLGLVDEYEGSVRRFIYFGRETCWSGQSPIEIKPENLDALEAARNPVFKWFDSLDMDGHYPGYHCKAWKRWRRNNGFADAEPAQS